MTRQIIVVENLADWKLDGVETEVVHADDYLTGRDYFKQKNIQVINLCRSYRYLSVGYYCSLLAEARGHRALPSVKTMLDLSRKSMYSLDTENLDQQIQKAFKKHVHGEGEERFDIDGASARSRLSHCTGWAKSNGAILPMPSSKTGCGAGVHRRDVPRRATILPCCMIQMIRNPPPLPGR